MKSYSLELSGWPHAIKFPSEYVVAPGTQSKGFSHWVSAEQDAFAAYLRSPSNTFQINPAENYKNGQVAIISTLPSPKGTTQRKLWSDLSIGEEEKIYAVPGASFNDNEPMVVDSEESTTAPEVVDKGKPKVKFADKEKLQTPTKRPRHGAKPPTADSADASTAKGKAKAPVVETSDEEEDAKPAKRPRHAKEPASRRTVHDSDEERNAASAESEEEDKMDEDSSIVVVEPRDRPVGGKEKKKKRAGTLSLFQSVPTNFVTSPRAAHDSFAQEGNCEGGSCHEGCCKGCRQEAGSGEDPARQTRCARPVWSSVLANLRFS